MGTWKFIGKAAWVWAFCFAFGLLLDTLVGNLDFALAAVIASIITAIWAVGVTSREAQR
jgi:hypothetical protein